MWLASLQTLHDAEHAGSLLLAAAEGDSYGQQDGGGNGAAYLANALVSAAAAAVFIVSPETVPPPRMLLQPDILSLLTVTALVRACLLDGWPAGWLGSTVRVF